MIVKGAGVLLIQKVNRDKVFVLFKNKKNMYMELGGGRDGNESVYKTAQREVCEESYSTVHISKDTLIDLYKHKKYYDGVHNNRIYRCFFHELDGDDDVITRKAFLKNKNIFKYLLSNNIPIPDYYFETVDVSFFNIDTVRRDIKKNTHTEYLTNTENIKCKIRDRTIEMLQNYILKNK